MSFGQISSWRSGGGNNSSSHNSQSTYSQPSIRQTQPNVSQWRSEIPQAPVNPKNYYQPSYKSYRYLSPYPYYGTYGWYSMRPYYWYDPYGYRVRGYVHIYENGRQDTIKGQSLHTNLGIQFSGRDLLGGYITIGNEGYFIAELLDTKRTPNTTYFPYGRLNQVDFPLISDERLMKIFYFGGGKMISHKTGYHVEIGFGNEVVNYRGKDQLGYITFPKYSNNFTTVKFGMIHNYKNLGLKFDFDPVKDIFTWGLGIHL